MATSIHTAPAVWKTLLLGSSLLLVLSCERIEPVRQAPELAEGAVTLTCEGCHTTRAYLRRLAIDDGSGGGGGGG
jgi:hypothetical protein